jgi:hypothetical protein
MWSFCEANYSYGDAGVPVKSSPLPATTWVTCKQSAHHNNRDRTIHAGTRRGDAALMRGLAGAESVRESLYIPWVFLLVALGGGPRWRAADGGQRQIICSSGAGKAAHWRRQTARIEQAKRSPSRWTKERCRWDAAEADSEPGVRRRPGVRTMQLAGHTRPLQDAK